MENHIPDLSFPDGFKPAIALPLESRLSKDSIESILSADAGFISWKSQTESTLVIVNDGTRPTPTAAVLEAYEDFFSSPSIFYIVATGAHKPPSGDEWEFIFGKLFNRIKDQIIVHDARNAAELESYGTTSRGTEVHFNKILTRFNRILVIGSVEPHYFAGFTGGRKAFLPGIADYESITANHKLALEPSAGLMKLAGNPVHEDMSEAASFLHGKSIFSIMSVLDKDQRISSIHTGGLIESFGEAAAAARRVYKCPVAAPANIIITKATAPMNNDLYQSQKAIENVRGALAPGGIIILLSPCSEGIGDSSFYNVLAAADSPAAAIEQIRHDYKLGYHKVARLVDLFSDTEIYAVTGIEDRLLEDIFFSPFDSAQSAFDEARRKHLEQTGLEPFVLIVPDGSVTVPVVEKEDTAML